MSSRPAAWRLALSLIYSMNLVPDLDFFHLMLYRAAQTAALSLLFVPISTIAYATIPRELNGDAAALFSMSRNVFGGIGISVSTALVNNHLQIRQSYLIDHLTPVNQPYNVLLQQIQQGMVDAGPVGGAGGAGRRPARSSRCCKHNPPCWPTATSS